MQRILSRTTANITAISVLLLLSACTHTRVVTSASPDAYAEINHRGARSTATIALNTGQWVTAQSLHIAPDVVTWIDPESGEAGSAPTSDLTSVRFMNRGRGALEGLAIGLAAGVVVGAAVGLLAHDDTPACVPGFICLGTPRGVVVMTGIAVIGTPSAGVGALAGWLRGSRTIYTVPVQPIDRNGNGAVPVTSMVRRQ